MRRRKPHARGGSFVRQGGGRTPRARILIACEGATEKAYLHELRRFERLTAIHIELTPKGRGRAPGPRALVSGAVKALEERLFDEAWCVFDDDGRAGVASALEYAVASNVRVAFSNPAFELWYLLHFKNQRAALTSKEATRLVKSDCPGWSKPESLYSQVQPEQALAAERAESLEKMHCEAGRPITSNPSTSVFRLVLRLKAEAAWD